MVNSTLIASGVPVKMGILVQSVTRTLTNAKSIHPSVKGEEYALTLKEASVVHVRIHAPTIVMLVAAAPVQGEEPAGEMVQMILSVTVHLG